MEDPTKGRKVTNCPLHLDFCHPCCNWWGTVNSKPSCRHPSFTERKQLDDFNVMKDASRLNGTKQEA